MTALSPELRPAARTDVRLAEWWPAAIVGGLLSLLGLIPDGQAQSPLSTQIAEAQRLADHMAINAPGWRQDLRNYVVANGNRGAVVERTKTVLEAYRDRCGGAVDACGAGPDTVRQAVQTAAGAACQASVVPVTIDRNFVPPKGTLGFDFQPTGGRTAPGFRPVVPGDVRMQGGDKPGGAKDKDDLSFDWLTDVKRFQTKVPEDGEYRVIIVGAAGNGKGANPFGNQITINGRTVEVASGTQEMLAQLGGALRNVRIMGSSQAPMLVFDLTIANRELDLQFLSGGVVSGLVLEPVGNKSVLSLPSESMAGNVTSIQQCMSAQTDLQQAASDDVVTKRNKMTQVTTGGGGGGGGTPGGGGGRGGSPTNVTQLSGN
jgi:hypothetical protein